MWNKPLYSWRLHLYTNSPYTCTCTRTWQNYSGTSEQGTRLGNINSRFVLCREVVLFSEVENVLRKSEYLGPQAASLVERSIIHCPYLGGFTLGGFTVIVLPWLSLPGPHWGYSCTKDVPNRGVSIPYSQEQSSIPLPKPVAHHSHYTRPASWLHSDETYM